jgi:glycerol-3-phosphate dehydrogenase
LTDPVRKDDIQGSLLERALKKRKAGLSRATTSEWDYTIIGAGITGVQTFRVLSAKGYKVLLVDANDFSSGTSSNSGMLIWGGLLYLKHLDFKSVFRFSNSRDNLVENDSENLKVVSVTYLTDTKKFSIEVALWVYWLFSLFRRKRPSHPSEIEEQAFLQRRFKHYSVFEEALIQTSDSRYVIDIIMHCLDQHSEAKAFNYLELVRQEGADSKWTLVLKDRIGEEEITLTTKNLINCAGVRASEVHSLLGLEKAPFRHLWSKGVYLNLRRDPSHKAMLIFDDPHADDVQTYCPVGKISFFGPTEENIDQDRHNAFRLTREDIAQLREKYEICTGRRLKREDVVSYRLGVRPLCVPVGFSADGYTLSVSRNSKVHHVPERNYSAVFGGKFTGSYDIARKTAKHFGVDEIPEESGISPLWRRNIGPQFVGVERALLDEQCWTLRDYLRHRTFIHQSESNGGFGADFQEKESIKALSSNFLQKIGAIDVSFSAYYREQKELDALFEKVLNE